MSGGRTEVNVLIKLFSAAQQVSSLRAKASFLFFAAYYAYAL